MIASSERTAARSRKAEPKPALIRIFVCFLVTVSLLTISIVEAQQPTEIPKIGFLAIRPDAATTGFAQFRRELRHLGYVEGKNFTFEYRSANNQLERLPALVDELVRLRVDMIVTGAANETRAAKNATKTIPIVCLSIGDPVVLGLVNSLARPGGNITGFTTISGELHGKRLELLKETIPKLSRVAVLWHPQTSSGSQQWKEIQVAGRDLGLQLHSIEINNSNQFESAFKEIIKSGSTALTVSTSPLINTHQKKVVELAAKNRLPAIYARDDFVDSGGLMSYGAERSESARRVAVMANKILKGAKPADLPIEGPREFDLVINLKMAKQIGVTIPQRVLARADRVIK